MSNAVKRFAGEDEKEYRTIDEQFKAVPHLKPLGPDQGEAESVI